ncbi:MAG: Hpt domain-containing protein [Phycisphaerae bacterium]
MSEPFDRDELIDRVDGDFEFLEDTVSMLDEDSPDLLEQIRVAAKAQDAESLVTAAHTLKGMLANFCAETAEGAARELESMGREGRVGDLESAAEVVERETLRLQAALREFLQSKST